MTDQPRRYAARGPAPRPAVRSVEEATALFERHQALLPWTMRRLFGDDMSSHPHVVAAGGVEEIRQRGLFALWHCCLRFDPGKGARFGSYAIRCLMVQMRGKAGFGASPRYALIEHPEWVPGLSCVEDQVEAAEQSSRILAAVRRLPPKWAAVVRAYFWENLTFREIAARLGTSTARPHQIFTSALSMLRVLLRRTDHG